MSKIPADLSYARTHEWVRRLNDGNVEVGITDHAQAALGDLVFVQLPEPGHTVAAQEACCVVESVKAASDVYAPLAGSVIGSSACASTPWISLIPGQTPPESCQPPPEPPNHSPRMARAATNRRSASSSGPVRACA